MEQRTWKKIEGFDFKEILFDIYNGIAKITINRPEVYNAFRPLTNHEMLDAFEICRGRDDIRVIILTGAGDKAFCSGGDQHYKTQGGYRDSDGTPRLNVLDLHKMIRSIPKPRDRRWKTAQISSTTFRVSGTRLWSKWLHPAMRALWSCI